MLGFSDIIPLFFASVIMVLKPGPYVLATTSLAAKGNLRAFFVFWLGSTITSTIVYLIILRGLNFIPENYGIIFIFFKAMAAIAFITIGFLTMKENQDFSDEQIEARAKKISFRDAYANFMAGATLSVSNPYDIVFIFTVIPSLVGLTVFSFQDIFLIRGTIMLADILVISAYCIPVLILRQKLRKNKIHIIRQICGLAMIGIGIFLMFNIVLQSDLIQSNLIHAL